MLLNSSGTTAVDWQNGFFGSGSTAVTIDDPNIEISSSYFIKQGSGEGFQILTTTASLNFPSVAGNSTESLTVPVTGAAENDIVLLGIGTTISAGLTFLGHVSTAGVVEVDAVNATNSAIDPAASTFRIMVLNFS